MSRRSAVLVMGLATASLSIGVVPPLQAAGAASNTHSLEVRRLTTLPHSVGRYAKAFTVVAGSAVAGDRLWVGFDGLSASTPRGDCVAVTGCQYPPATATPGLLAVLSTATGRVVRTVRTGTLPTLASSGQDVWVATTPTLPRDLNIGPEMPLLNAVGGGFVTDYDGHTAKRLHRYRVPFPVGVVADGAKALVFAANPTHPYEGGRVMELTHGHDRVLDRSVAGWLATMTLCGGRLVVDTNIPGPVYPSDEGYARAIVTVFSHRLTKERSFNVAVTSQMICTGKRLMIFHHVFTSNTTVATVLRPGWDLRPTGSVTLGHAVLSAASAMAGSWFLALAGVTRHGYRIEHFSGGHLSVWDEEIPPGESAPRVGSLAVSGRRLLFLIGANVYLAKTRQRLSSHNPSSY